MVAGNLKPHIIRTSLAVIVIIASLSQLTDGPLQHLFGISILFIIPTIVSISMFEGELISMSCGLLAGFLWDSVSANGHYFHSVTLAITAFTISYLVQRRIRNTLFAYMIVNSITLLTHVLIYWLLYVVTPSPTGAGLALIKFYIPSFLITTVVGIIIFPAIRFVHQLFKRLP